MICGIFDRAMRRPYHAPAMANPLLENVLPAELADRNQVIDVKGEIGNFARLVEIVEAELRAADETAALRDWRHRPVDVALRFGWVDQERTRPRVVGTIRARMPLVCQRCLQHFEYPLEVPVNLVFIRAQDVADDDGEEAGDEVWELDGDTVRLADIVEEALIMSLPLAAMHESRQDCGPLAEKIGGGEKAATRPFQDLRSQMERAKK